MAGFRFALRGGLAICFALTTSSLLAQVTQETTTTTVQTPTGTTTQIRTVTTVIGSNVRLQDGVTFGKIEDIVLNDSGCLEYLVVSQADQYYVVPWSVAQVNYQERFISLNTTQQVLRQAAFPRNDWRNVSYDKVSQKAQQVFSSSAGGPGGRVNREGAERKNDQARPKGGERPLEKARPSDPSRKQGDSPDRARPRDGVPGKAQDRPLPKDGSAPPKKENRPGANPSEPQKPSDQSK